MIFTAVPAPAFCYSLHPCLVFLHCSLSDILLEKKYRPEFAVQDEQPPNAAQCRLSRDLETKKKKKKKESSSSENQQQENLIKGIVIDKVVLTV